MKKSFKYLGSAFMALLITLSVHSFGYAQHGRGGGGGGGFHGGGSFGGHSGGFSGHSSGSFSGGNRGSFSGRSSAPAPQRSTTQQQSHVTTSQGYHSAPQSYNRGRVGVTNQHSTYVTRGSNGRVGNSSYYRGGNTYYRGGHYYRGGYYNRFYAPRLGLRINVLPFGYYPFYYGDAEFYYNAGLFYQQSDNNDYTVVAPPIGAIVPQVPQDAKSITIDGQQYYELNGIYYQPVTNQDGTTGYKIVGKDGELNTDQNDQGGDAYPPDNGSEQ